MKKSPSQVPNNHIQSINQSENFQAGIEGLLQCESEHNIISSSNSFINIMTNKNESAYAVQSSKPVQQQIHVKQENDQSLHEENQQLLQNDFITGIDDIQNTTKQISDPINFKSQIKYKLEYSLPKQHISNHEHQQKIQLLSPINNKQNSKMLFGVHQQYANSSNDINLVCNESISQSKKYLNKPQLNIYEPFQNPKLFECYNNIKSQELGVHDQNSNTASALRKYIKNVNNQSEIKQKEISEENQIKWENQLKQQQQFQKKSSTMLITKIDSSQLHLKKQQILAQDNLNSNKNQQNASQGGIFVVQFESPFSSANNNKQSLEKIDKITKGQLLMPFQKKQEDEPIEPVITLKQTQSVQKISNVNESTKLSTYQQRLTQSDMNTKQKYAVRKSLNKHNSKKVKKIALSFLNSFFRNEDNQIENNFDIQGKYVQKTQNKRYLYQLNSQAGTSQSDSNSSQISQQQQLLNQNLIGANKQVCCSCKKSRCLKQYCDCFKQQQYCKDCNCVDCLNLLEYKEIRDQAIKQQFEKDRDIFQQSKGCNCKRSNCLKNYCECHQAGIPCTSLCRCIECQNHDTNVITKISIPNPLLALTSSDHYQAHSHSHHKNRQLSLLRSRNFGKFSADLKNLNDFPVEDEFVDKHDPFCKKSMSEMSDKHSSAKHQSYKKVKLSAINSIHKIITSGKGSADKVTNKSQLFSASTGSYVAHHGSFSSAEKPIKKTGSDIKKKNKSAMKYQQKFNKNMMDLEDNEEEKVHQEHEEILSGSVVSSQKFYDDQDNDEKFSEYDELEEEQNEDEKKQQKLKTPIQKNQKKSNFKITEEDEDDDDEEDYLSEIQKNNGNKSDDEDFKLKYNKNQLLQFQAHTPKKTRFREQQQASQQQQQLLKSQSNNKAQKTQEKIKVQQQYNTPQPQYMNESQKKQEKLGGSDQKLSSNRKSKTSVIKDQDNSSRAQHGYSGGEKSTVSLKNKYERKR